MHACSSEYLLQLQLQLLAITAVSGATTAITANLAACIRIELAACAHCSVSAQCEHYPFPLVTLCAACSGVRAMFAYAHILSKTLYLLTTFVTTCKQHYLQAYVTACDTV
jgi:p-aminobenzoyl-glutamate transporter AbgT